MNLSVNTLVTDARSVSCDIKGKFDYYTLDFYSTKSDGLSFYSVTSCAAIKDYKLPDISSLVSFYAGDFNNLEFRSLYVYDPDKFNPKILPYVNQFKLSDQATIPVKVAQKYNPKFGYNILASGQPMFRLE